MTPDAGRLMQALAATWPPACWHEVAGWRIGEGAGGGQRVSAARAVVADPDMAAMEAAQARLGQSALVQVGPGEEALDAALAARGYRLQDETVLLAAPAGALWHVPPRVTVFEVDRPALVAQREVWAAEGVDPARLAVMARAPAPCATLMGRLDDTPAAAAFVAVAGELAFLHALAVLPDKRRRGLAGHLVAAAAGFALRHGARTLATATVSRNAAARALFAGLGMAEAGRYHYRLKSGPEPR